MYHNSYSEDPQLNKTMTNEQFNQVVDAILSGKYSWACLLILRFAGYNPLHYIPYRTYNRLMKTNRQLTAQSGQTIGKVIQDQESRFTEQPTRKIQDLYFLEEAEQQSSKIKGGKGIFSMGIFSRLFPS